MGCYRKGVHPIINTNTPLIVFYGKGVYDRDTPNKKGIKSYATLIRRN
jgi:hypothetical protein